MLTKNAFIATLFVTTLSTLTLRAQNSFPASGNVNIATTTAESPLQIGSSLSRINFGEAGTNGSINWNVSYIGFNLARTGGSWTTKTNGAQNGGSGILMDTQGQLSFTVLPNSGNTNRSGITDATVASGIKMRILTEGKVTIGNISSIPGEYKLYVESGILTEKVKIALKSTGDWADYVFSPSYILKPLAEVETFLKANKHLEGIPSADALVKNGGVDVAVLQAKQMEKIEELTLYLIEQNKTLTEQKKLLQLQGEKIQQLENGLEVANHSK